MYLPQTEYQLLPRSPDLVSWYASNMLFGNLSSLPVDGIGVNYMTDCSGRGFSALQSSGILQPTFKTNVINGLPILRFSSNRIQPSGTNNAINGITSITCFVVSKQASFAANNTIFTYTVNAGTNVVRLNFITNTTPRYSLTVRPADGGTTNVLSAGNPSTQAFQYVTAQWVASTTTALIRVNGVEVGISTSYGTSSDSIPNNDSGSFAIGGNGITPNTSLTGDLAEILIYKRQLSAVEIIQVELYLKNKFGL